MLSEHSIEIQNALLTAQEERIKELEAAGVPPEDDAWFFDDDDIDDNDPDFRAYDIIDEHGNAIKHQNYSVYENVKDRFAEMRDKYYGVVDENDFSQARRVAEARWR